MRFLMIGTLAGGLVLTVLNWVTAAILPPRYKHFKDPHAVVEAIRAKVSGSDIYTAAQGLFVSVSLRPRLQSFGPRIASQLFVEFAVALGLSLLVLATPLRSSIHAVGFLGLAGLIAWCRDTFSELELGRVSNELSTGRECVSSRKLVYHRAGARSGESRKSRSIFWKFLCIDLLHEG